jgi:hypothetical protein
MNFFIHPTPRDLAVALESWEWLGIGDITPERVTAFGDVFFRSPDGAILFLDTLEGTLTREFDSSFDMERVLSTEEGQDHYLLAGFVIRAWNEDYVLETDECYTWILHPVLGGPCEYANVRKTSFAVATNLAGQIHDQVRDFPPGTKVSGFVFDDGN